MIEIIITIIISLMLIGFLLFGIGAAVYIIKNDMKIKKLLKYREQGKKCNMCKYRDHLNCEYPGRKCGYESMFK